MNPEPPNTVTSVSNVRFSVIGGGNSATIPGCTEGAAAGATAACRRAWTDETRPRDQSQNVMILVLPAIPLTLPAIQLTTRGVLRTYRRTAQVAELVDALVSGTSAAR